MKSPEIVTAAAVVALLQVAPLLIERLPNATGAAAVRLSVPALNVRLLTETGATPLIFRAFDPALTVTAPVKVLVPVAPDNTRLPVPATAVVPDTVSANAGAVNTVPVPITKLPLIVKLSPVIADAVPLRVKLPPIEVVPVWNVFKPEVPRFKVE